MKALNSVWGQQRPDQQRDTTCKVKHSPVPGGQWAPGASGIREPPWPLRPGAAAHWTRSAPHASRPPGTNNHQTVRRWGRSSPKPCPSSSGPSFLPHFSNISAACWGCSPTSCANPPHAEYVLICLVLALGSYSQNTTTSPFVYFRVWFLTLSSKHFCSNVSHAYQESPC